MMDKDILLSPIRLADLADIIEAKVKAAIKAERQAEQMEKMLSPSETCKLFQPAISRQTLNTWSNDGHLQKHVIGGRVYYKYGEVLEATKILKRYKSKIDR